MGDPIWGMLLLAIFRVLFFRSEKKWLEATSRVDMGHVLGPKSHVSLASLVRLLFALAMEIWDCECGQFGQISLLLPF